MILLGISIVLIVIAAYAIYRHYKTRQNGLLRSGRNNKKR